jgi:AraC-like DNA-binding protein
MNGKLEFFYYRSHEGETYVDFHQHNCFELVYYETGTGAMRLDGQTLPYTPGTLTLTRPNFMHDERHDAETDVIFFGFSFDDSPFALRNGVYRDSPEGEIGSLMRKMKAELLAKRPFYSARVGLLLNEILVLVARQLETETEAARPEKLFYARRFIDENFTQAVSLKTLAELSGYSEDHFRHLFKEWTGLPPAQYVLRKRLEEARLQLRQSAKSVSEIGADCGFSTTSQFIELFKRTYGQTPLKFRIDQQQ